MGKNKLTTETTTEVKTTTDQLRLLAIPEEYASLLELVITAQQRASEISNSISRTFWHDEVIILADTFLASMTEGLHSLGDFIGSQIANRVHLPEKVAELGKNKVDEVQS